MDLENTAHGGKVAASGLKVCITMQPIMHEPSNKEGPRRRKRRTPNNLGPRHLRIRRT